MAISIVKFREKKAYGVYEFLCDFDSDVKDLRTDCAPGSKAQVAESGKNYVFNSLKQWKEVESSGGSWTPTEEDLNDIAQRLLNYLPTAEGVLYGNQVSG